MPRKRSAGRADPPLVLVLPGSRSSELQRLLPIFGAAMARVGARIGAMELVLPTMPHLLPKVREETARWPVQPRIVTEPKEKWAAFRNGARGACGVRDSHARTGAVGDSDHCGLSGTAD